LRYVDGQFRTGRAIWHGHCLDALLMEALACKDGVLLAQQCGISKVCVETDCLELIKLWENLDSQRSTVNLFLWEIRDMCRSFDEFKLVFASRSCNGVAHECAKHVSCEQTRRSGYLTLR
ncbi:hypothetical protein BAE44_0001827, partial [Dichanthelium oligosanthes]